LHDSRLSSRMQTRFVLPSFPISRVSSEQSSPAFCKNVSVSSIPRIPLGAKTSFFSLPLRFSPRNRLAASKSSEFRPIPKNGAPHDSAVIWNDASPTVGEALSNVQEKKEAEEDSASVGKGFNWLHQWYPVHYIRDFPSDRPFPFQLFDEDYVLWRDTSGAYHCLHDRCPHRAAALSIGRIEGGNLECRYHGWQFDGAGKCVEIPQLFKADADMLNDRSSTVAKKSCVKSFPTAVRDGVVWMTPDRLNPPSEDSIPVPVGLKDETYIESSDFVADVPINWMFMSEMAFDPAHFAFVHHGSLSSREKAAPCTTTLTSFDSTGIVGATEIPLPGGRMLTFPMRWRAPLFHQVDVLTPQGRSVAVVYIVPSAVGRTRHFIRIAQAKKAPFDYLPRWVRHTIYTMRVESEDIHALYGCEQSLSKESSTWKKAYFLPSPDVGHFVAFHKWLDNALDTAPQGLLPLASSEPVPKMTDSVLFDRYHQHVAQCSSCSNALKNLKNAKTASVAVSAVSVGFTALTRSPIFLALSLLCVTLYGGVSWFEPFFAVMLPHRD